MADRTISVELRALTDQYRRNMEQAGRSTQQTGKHATGTDRAMGGLRNAARQLIPVLGVAGLARAGAQAARQALELESSLFSMQTQIGLSAAEVSQFSDEFGRLGSTTGKTGLELADASWQIASAGLRGADALDALESAAKASAVGFGEINTIAGLTSAAVNAYGSDVLTAAEATDVLAAAVRSGTAAPEELASTMGSVLPIASEMGIQFHEIGAAQAAMTRTGTDAATSVTQLRAILTLLLNPAEGSAQAMAEFGLSAEGIRATIREDGLWEALMMMRDAIGDNENALGRIFPNVRALAGFLDLTGANAESNAEVFRDLAAATGLVDEAHEKWGETTAAEVAKAKANWQNFKVEVVGNILPALNLALSDINNTMERGLPVPGGANSILDTLRDMAAAPLNLPMLRYWVDTFKEGTEAGRQMREVWEQPFGLEDYEEEFLRLNGQMGNTPPAANAAADAIEGVGDAADDTRTSIERLNDDLNALVGVHLDAESAAIRVEAGFADLTDTLAENGATLDRTTEKGRANEEAIIAQSRAILDEVTARHEQGDSLADISVLYGRQVDRLRDVMRQAGLTEAEIDDYIKTLGLTPDVVATTVQADTGRAQSAVESFIRATGRIPRFTHTTVTVGVDSSAYNRAMGRVNLGQPIHTGGYIHPSGKLQRFHAGGMVGGGLKSDEVPAILQTGEMVLSRQQVAQIGDAFSNPQTASGGLTVNQTFAADIGRDTLAEARHQQRIAFLEAV